MVANFPGGLVKQREAWDGRDDSMSGDCFTACVSMVTGIDLELLPVLPPAFWMEPSQEGWIHLSIIPEDWETWAALLADNGYQMETHNDVLPDRMGIISAAHMVEEIGHAFAQDANGSIYNPADLSPESVSNMAKNGWAIFAFTTITEVH